MLSDWRVGTLGDIAEVVMGTSPPGEVCNSTNTGWPLLNGPTEFGLHHPVPEQYTTEPVKMADAGDILFCVRGSTTGRMNWADQRYAIGRGLAAIRHRDSRKCDPFVRAVIENGLPHLLAIATGSTFPAVSRFDIEGMRTLIPPLEEQLAISAILGSLSDKIELNRRIGETLEAMARKLFQSWFVDFDPVRAKSEGRHPQGVDARTAGLFSKEFVESRLGSIPKGWRVGHLEEVAEIVMGSSPPGETYNEAGIGTPLVNGPVEFGDYFTIKGKWTTQPVKLSQPNDLVFCVRGSTTGRRVVADDVYCLGRGVCAIRAKDGAWGYVHRLVDFSLDRILSRVSGSVFPNLNGPDLKRFEVVIPDERLIADYQHRVEPWLSLIGVRVRESVILAALRDAMLPKLLSGELPVHNLN